MERAESSPARTTIFIWDIRDYQIPRVPTNFMCSSKLVTRRPVMVFLLHGKLLAYAADGHAKVLYNLFSLC